ncbi:hypothetical protein GIB67_005174 [Kingdonia uniflora]|uniref:U-box domain-containing protein n=1 Tax=Kingdonia uniflora TaxID=39325 RepID=A0A7J7NNN8_9MAGN|nr:hypothetical protein GIB67_005174 [Kingdonia uniflora]
MISTWRERRASRRNSKKNIVKGDLNMSLTVPTHFRCPISLELMKDPVTLCTGITYDRQSIETWVEAGNKKCPVTNQVLRSLELIPNHAIRRMIQDWCVQNRNMGIERIPTPRIPISPFEVSEIFSRITKASRGVDQDGCRVLVEKINNLGKESERNKSCIVSNGSAKVFAAAFESFAASSIEKTTGILEDILSSLTWMFPIDAEAQSHLGSRASLRCMVWFLKCGGISGRRNAVLVLKELSALDQRHIDALAEIEDVIEPLFKLIKEPICPTATKSALLVTYYLVSSSPRHSQITSKFANLGLVPLLVENLVEGEKSVCEKALAILDTICSYAEGREKAYNHALTMPVLVKKLLRVSNLATEFAVSVVWKLCKNEKRDKGGVIVEALQVGAFQKLLLLLQVGCSERSKEKATELLKLLNLQRMKSECIDTVDFKELRRPI